jgi:hypothetical protein
VQRQYEARKAEHQRMMELRLTWEQFSAGEPCPGCGRPDRGSRVELPGLACQLLEAGEESGMVDSALSIEAEPLRARMVEDLLTAGCVKQVSNGLVITDRGRGVLADRREDEAFLRSALRCSRRSLSCFARRLPGSSRAGMSFQRACERRVQGFA